MHSICLGVTLMLAGCDAQNEYSSYPCYIYVDNSVHLDASLASAMNSVSPGIFCMVQQSSGGTQFQFSTNQGLSSTVSMVATESRQTMVFGMNNGVIVGFGNLDSPATFYAYDRECPNCFDPDAVPVRSKALTMDSSGYAKCSVCGRTYDMNNRGYIISGDNGNALTRYPASTSGPYGVLVVY